MDYNLMSGDIQDWLGSDVTKAFFERVALHRDDADREVHKFLSKYELNQAALNDAAKAAFEEVLLLPEIMINELKEVQ